MSYSVTIANVKAGDRTGLAYRLEGNDCRAEVWPTHGFNCLRWQKKNADGSWGDLLFAMPDWEQNPVPTRSGHPVLFPFPNRLRHGRFVHAGTTYQLPLNEGTGKHAIHGFTPRAPWRVVDSGSMADSAYITGEFQISKDAPQAVDCWPADARLRLTYRLTTSSLRVEAKVDAADGKELPFGLGYHPYFRAPGGAETVTDWILTAPATQTWELAENLPTGKKLPVEGQYDFRSGAALGAVVLDTAYTSLENKPIGGTNLLELSRLENPGGNARLVIAADSSFRELLLFTPQHRKAVAIEPYTCATDAANRDAEAKVAAGWIVLPAGKVWQGVVEYRLERNS
jgi:aldose 1-epimerase